MDKLSLAACRKIAAEKGYRIASTRDGYVLSYRVDLNTLHVSEPMALADIVDKINSNYLK